MEFLERYWIPARVFNGVRVYLEGKITSVNGAMELRRDDLERRILRAQEQIARAGDGDRRDWLHQRWRRLENLKARLERLESDIAARRIRLCFGSRKLSRKQHSLAANGYSSHGEWLRAWRYSRSAEFFVLVSKGETAAASYAWPRWPMMGPWTCGSGCPTPWQENWQVPGHARSSFQIWARAGLGRLGEQCLVFGIPSFTWGEGSPSTGPGPGNQLPVQARRQGLPGLREYGEGERAGGDG